ncbi:hypothetical protein [Chitinophaga arvensicola]|uniref:Uncharacterized protein n=1 Tax=Chitinophaga arvensicola TaxID=29529 RepID=A0A1I0S738_9BACT|nr:hypothetical protein [Chitinophaga arvensicola]SEW51466.1 hypothetical protein SAMN04488122_4250 [Chitinophaga arvensicola]
MGIIVFYEGNNGSQNIVQTVEDTPGQNFRPVKNDEIRSCKLYGVRVGCVITLFDSPDGSMSDDFTIINVKRISPEYTVNTFERSYEDEYVVVSYIRNNGLDGKVSRIKID